MHTIAVYGSLKKGKHNHRYLEGSKFIEYTEVIGTMYLVSTYPALLQEGTGVYMAEKYEVSDEVYQTIRSLELRSGYKEVHTPKGIIFYADAELAEHCRENKEVILTY